LRTKSPPNRVRTSFFKHYTPGSCEDCLLQATPPDLVKLASLLCAYPALRNFLKFFQKITPSVFKNQGCNFLKKFNLEYACKGGPLCRRTRTTFLLPDYTPGFQKPGAYRRCHFVPLGDETGARVQSMMPSWHGLAGHRSSGHDRSSCPHPSLGPPTLLHTAGTRRCDGIAHQHIHQLHRARGSPRGF